MAWVLFHLVRDSLAQVVQKAAHAAMRTLACSSVADGGRQVGCFDGVIELVLPKGGAEFETSQQPLNFACSPGAPAPFDDGLFAGLHHNALNFLLRFFYFLFNACGVDAPVGDKLAQRHARHFVAHGIKAADCQRLGCVVHDQALHLTLVQLWMSNT